MNSSKESVQECRRVLGDLVGAYLERDTTQYAPVMRELATQGANLYFLLFGGARNSEITDTVAGWLAGLHDQVRLIISSDASIHVPWGLVFAGEEEKIADGAVGIEQYGGFWALKYQLTVLYSGMAPKSLREPRQRQDFKMLSILNREAFRIGEASLGTSERQALTHFLCRPEGSADSLNSCRDKWTLMTANDCLLYVFAHASGTHIELSDQDRINVVELRRRFLDPRRRGQARVPECLIVLNGCKTAVGMLDNSFLTATAEAGCCGFVGCEAPVPTEFAMRFGIALLHMLLHSGASVLEAVDQLRRQHWPIGLLYGCYSHPDFRVEANPVPQAPPFGPQINFSLHRDPRQ